jgi:hypothetical protein
MRGLNILPHKRKRKAPDDAPRSPTAYERSPHSAPTLPGELFPCFARQVDLHAVLT